jgi:transcriptional antiterminator
MSRKKNKKFKKMREKLWAGASGSILAGMMIVGANTAYADMYVPKQYEQTYSKTSGMHTIRRWNSTTKVNSLASQLGLNRNQVRRELKSGKTIKQILQDYDISLNDVQKAYDLKGEKLV